MEALSQNEEKYRNLFEDSMDMIFLTSYEGEFLDINQAGLDLLGYTDEEIKQVSISRIHAKEMVKMEEIWLQVSNFGVARSDDLTCRTKNNKVIPADISFS